MCRKHNKNGIAHDIMKMVKYRDEDNETRRRVRNAKRGEARRKAAWIPAKTALFAGMNPLKRKAFQR